MWGIMIGNVAFWIGLFLWRGSERPSAQEASTDLMHVLFMIIIGLFFLGIGVIGYFVVLLTQCFSFDFKHPVWPGIKGKLFVANILVPLAASLGLGFALSSVLTPMLIARGVSSEIAGLIPVLGMVGVVQIVQLWILVWAPLEKRVIRKRLEAQGIVAGQLNSAVLVGLSDPASGMLKRFGMIEEDVGALWVGPEQLVYWGDRERFGISREQITRIERKADTRSTSLLGGIAHVILHVATPSGTERQIRLHTEGHWTMGQKREAMDRLGDVIEAWHRPAATPQLA